MKTDTYKLDSTDSQLEMRSALKALVDEVDYEVHSADWASMIRARDILSRKEEFPRREFEPLVRASINALDALVCRVQFDLRRHEPAPQGACDCVSCVAARQVAIGLLRINGSAVNQSHSAILSGITRYNNIAGLTSSDIAYARKSDRTNIGYNEYQTI